MLEYGYVTLIRRLLVSLTSSNWRSRIILSRPGYIVHGRKYESDNVNCVDGVSTAGGIY